MKNFKPCADFHTHTIASTHAYSTVMENAKYASELGLSHLAITDHGPEMADAPHIWHFRGIRSIPSELFGVKILRGIEANIRPNGTIDLEEKRDLGRMDIIVASIHLQSFGKPLTVEEHTQAYLGVARNPHVDIIGHSGLGEYQYDYETAIKEFGRHGKIVEINEHTFDIRKGSIKNCKTIAELCKKHSVQICVDSDAHFAHAIGEYEVAKQMLIDIDFPIELVVNRSPQAVEDYLSARAKRIKDSGFTAE